MIERCHKQHNQTMGRSCLGNDATKQNPFSASRCSIPANILQSNDAAAPMALLAPLHQLIAPSPVSCKLSRTAVLLRCCSLSCRAVQFSVGLCSMPFEYVLPSRSQPSAMPKQAYHYRHRSRQLEAVR